MRYPSALFFDDDVIFSILVTNIPPGVRQFLLRPIISGDKLGETTGTVILPMHPGFLRHHIDGEEKTQCPLAHRRNGGGIGHKAWWKL